MKRFLLISAVIGLSGVAFADDGLTLAQQNERQMETNRKVIERLCSPHCGHQTLDPSQSDWEAFKARDRAEGEIKLRKMGMDPEVARKAIWAAQNKPFSACAHWVHQLTADYDNGIERPDYDGQLVISVEHSGACERKNLD